MKEIIEKKNFREKHFLKSNGDMVAYVYDHDVHYLNNGKFENIDNTFLTNTHGFENKTNSFSSFFNKNNLLKIVKNKSYLVINLQNENSCSPTKKNNNEILFKNILDGIDIDYKLMDNKVKESLIINNRIENLTKLIFNVDTNMDLVEQNHKIVATSEDGDVFTIETPFMYDTNDIYSYNISYKLNKIENKYFLELLLDSEWLLAENRAYPVVIDPTITNSASDSNVYDTYIYSGDANVDRNSQDNLKVGIDSNNIVYRTLLKFNLPTIGTGSQIIDANVQLIGYPSYSSDWKEYSYIDVHEMTSDWDENTANWDNLNDKYNSRIESYGDFQYSTILGTTIRPSYSFFNLTNLVKKWYSGTPNYGIMLKSHIETREKNEEVCMFFSKNNPLGGDYNPKPILSITYRNQNGLEDYMSYKSQEFNEGTAYVNSYNGNLTTEFNIISTIGGKLPLNVMLYYNTNDVVLNNNYGYGLGYKLNYHEIIKASNIDDYIEYIDADGTTHYLYLENDNTYKDEDGLYLTVEKINNDYLMSDKENNKKEFILRNGMWYLSKIITKNNYINTIEYDDSNKIIKLTDNDKLEINISYLDDAIIFDNGNKKTTLVLNDLGQVTSITKNNSTTLYNYNNHNILEKIVDINGLSFKYEYYDVIPYRLKKITEIGLNGELGRENSIEYGFNVTSFTDNLGNKNTSTFNTYGNPISTTNLGIGESLKNAYGSNNLYQNFASTHNQLLSTELLNKDIKNYISNSSFETSEDIFVASGVTKSFVSEEFRTGEKCLKIVGNGFINKSINLDNLDSYYTFSAYFKGTGTAHYKVELPSGEKIIGETFELQNEYTRETITFKMPNNNSDNIVLYIYFENATAYIDDIQLENSEVANYYSIVDNCDFSNGMTNWELTCYDENLSEIASNDEIVKLENGLSALKVNHDPYLSKTLSRTFNISGKAGDTYFVSFWYKNNGLVTGLYSPYIANCMISFNFTNIPEDEIWEYEPFMESLNPNETEWQYFSACFTTEYDYDKVFFNLFMDNNANETYITNVTIYKDISRRDYNYDENGNVIEVNDLEDDRTVFNYDENNQLIQMTTQKGKNLSYEYTNDNNSRLLNSISDSGIANEIRYDTNDNPVLTRMRYVGNIEKNNSVPFLIRLKGTDKYLSANYHDKKLYLSDDSCNYDKWLITNSGDNLYTIKSALVPDLYISVNHYPNVILQKMPSYFYLEKNSNGSYYIHLYTGGDTSQYLKNDNDFITMGSPGTSQGNPYDPEDGRYENPNDFEFYFEDCSFPFYIENSAEYSEDGKFIKSTKNTLLKKESYKVNSSSGLVNIKTLPNGKKISYTYDEKENITKIKNNDKSIEYVYDKQNLLSQIKSGKMKYKFEYDEFLNLKTTKIGEDIVLLTNEYEPRNGNLSEQIYGNDNHIKYEYDEFNRLKKIVKQDSILNYKYDNFNNVAKIIVSDDLLSGDKEDHKYLYEHDKNQQVINYSYDNFKIKYDYENGLVSNKNYFLDGITENKEYSYDADDNLIRSTMDNATVIYNYDALQRIEEKIINNEFKTRYNYKTNGLKTSLLVSDVINNNEKYSYKYDALENITHIYINDELKNRYYYNEYNELIKEDDYNQNKTIKYTYDINGNLINKKVYELKTKKLLNNDSYSYKNSKWIDLLTSYNGINIDYDAIGNPVQIGDSILSWINGRDLKMIDDRSKGLHVEYKYNKDGNRISKVINNQIINYYLENGNIIFENIDGNMIYYLRDSNSDLIGCKYAGVTYYYLKNMQNDIIGLLDSEFKLIAKYQYDAWGKLLSIKDNNGIDITDESHIAMINPFRYRSYYYDKETKLYYINTRYYNPEWGRFINIDGTINANHTIKGNNLFSYVNNNPIKFRDVDGKVAGALAIAGGVGAAATLMLAKMAALMLVEAIAAASISKAAVSKVNSITKSNKSSKEKKNDSEKNYTVYGLKDSNDTVQYVGLTNNYSRREYEHKLNPARADLKMFVLESNLSKSAARGYEQFYIDFYRTLNRNNPMNNQINGISPKNRDRDFYLYSALGAMYDEVYVGGEFKWDPIK